MRRIDDPPYTASPPSMERFRRRRAAVAGNGPPRRALPPSMERFRRRRAAVDGNGPTTACFAAEHETVPPSPRRRRRQEADRLLRLAIADLAAV
jgi:hypothetical protein